MYQVAHDPTAIMGRRIGAWLIDFVFALVLTFIAFSAAVDGVQGIPGDLCELQGNDVVSDSDTNRVCRAHLGGEDGWAVYDNNTNESTFIESKNLWVPPAVFVIYGLFTFVLVEGLVG